MYIQKKIAQRKTRVHSDDTCISDPTGQLPWIDIKAYIPKGEIYYQVSNGTIGRGAYYKNFSQKAMMKIINSEARTWVQGFGSCTKEKLEKIKKEKKKIAKKKIETKSYNFSMDDIPF